MKAIHASLFLSLLLLSNCLPRQQSSISNLHAVSRGKCVEHIIVGHELINLPTQYFRYDDRNRPNFYFVKNTDYIFGSIDAKFRVYEEFIFFIIDATTQKSPWCCKKEYKIEKDTVFLAGSKIKLVRYSSLLKVDNIPLVVCYFYQENKAKNLAQALAWMKNLINTYQ
ncbi:MAG: hypothetical protein AB7D07_02880 [Desulfovibrionaceae bacterium]